MAEEHNDWSTSSNDATHISLVTPGDGGPKTLNSFNPKFSYPIFGDEETIFGYQGLKINIRYNACDMRPGLQIKFNKKFKTVGETEAADLKATLEPFLPKTAFEKSSIFDTAITDASYAEWKPPGELWKTIQSGDKTYEVWKGSLADMAVQQMVKRIQILVPFFIEGGTFIELRDPDWSLERWTIFFLYHKNTVDITANVSPYIFMGYSTVYRFFSYLATTPSALEKNKRLVKAATNFQYPTPKVSFSILPCRSRISQFIILPPFQGGGNGSRFYNAIFDYYLKEAQTMEITVEDPNEAFDDLRDLNDLARLRMLSDFTSLKINTSAAPRQKGPVPRDIVDLDALESIRLKMKIAPRQFSRVTEMHLLSLIPTNIRQNLLVESERKKSPDTKLKEHEYHLWQLWVKKRLYKHNKDTLIQLDRVERIEKLEQALSGVEADYARLIRSFESRRSPKTSPQSEGKTIATTAENQSNSVHTKRSSPDDEVEEGTEPVMKKVKFTAE